MSNIQINSDLFKVKEGTEISLRDYNSQFTDGLKNKSEAKEKLKSDIKILTQLQYQLYAENRQSLLIIFQAMDAAGKDGAIRHVFKGINPQGCEVYSFKKPSTNELEHDYLWRHYRKLPKRGNIGIFNRSHYENVLVTKVHPNFLLSENLPDVVSVNDVTPEFWEKRYEQINNFEKGIANNGTTIIKFFLNLSKEEQKNRFLERIENKEKNWKFSSADLEERGYWDDYQKAYELAINKTTTNYAPWYIIPADKKWFSRVAIGNIIVETLKNMNIKMPIVSEKNKAALQDAKQKLIEEK